MTICASAVTRVSAIPGAMCSCRRRHAEHWRQSEGNAMVYASLGRILWVRPACALASSARVPEDAHRTLSSFEMIRARPSPSKGVNTRKAPCAA
jgi:hypothetical protein